MTNPTTTVHPHTLIVVAAALHAAAVPALAQAHEPMRLVTQNRGNWVDIVDEAWGIEAYNATFNGTGMWAEAGGSSNHGASGEAAQWTRIDEDYIGGYLHSSMSSYGGMREDSGAVLSARFEIDRTGLMQARASFGGHFSNDLDESSACFKVARVDEDGVVIASLVSWTNLGENGDSADRDEWTSMLLHPGTYRVWADVQTNVRGVEIGPDLGSLDLLGSVQVERLPDCGEPGAGRCDQARDTPSCDDASCCTAVCAIDPYCCDNRWDEICVGEAAQECGPCAGDLNHDGTVNGADQGLLFAAWGSHSPTYIHPADLNGDGVVNGVDLGILFSHWGDC